MISDDFEVCCPRTLLDDLTTTGRMLNRFTHDIQYSVSEEIALSIELSPPRQGPELWAGLRLYLALEVVMPGPRSPEDMALTTSNALKATSPARVNSHRPAALPQKRLQRHQMTAASHPIHLMVLAIPQIQNVSHCLPMGMCRWTGICQGAPKTGGKTSWSQGYMRTPQ